MNRRRDLLLSLTIALILHAVVAVVADGVGVNRQILIMPEFQQGESSVTFNLLAAPEPPPPPAVPEPEPTAREIVVDPESPTAPDAEIPAPQVVKAEPESRPEEKIPPEPPPRPRDPEEKLMTPPQEQPQPQPPQIQIAKFAPPAENLDDTKDADSLIKGVDAPPPPASTIRPMYPLGARMRGEEGTVTLRVKVDTYGHVASVAVENSSGFSSLDGAAMKAVQKARFVPARTGGRIQETETTLTVRFRLVD